MIVEDHLRPAALKTGVIREEDGRTFDSNGNEIERFGFHSFRHSLTSFLIRNGENPKLVQTLLRWSKMDMTMYYAHSIQAKSWKRKAGSWNASVRSRFSERVPGRVLVQ